MKRIEVEQNGKVLATYYWDTKDFVYDEKFFKKHGDIFFSTDGSISKKHSQTPYFFTKYLPSKGTANFYQAVKKTGANPEDEFDLIKKCCEVLPASFRFKGIEK